MPLIDSQSVPLTMIEATFGFDGSESQLGVGNNLILNGEFGFEIESNLSSIMQLEVEGEFGFFGDDSFLRLDDEANIFLEVEGEFGIDEDVDMNVIKRFFLNCEFGISAQVDSNIQEEETYPFEIIIDIIPQPGAAKFEEYGFQLVVDGIHQIAIKSFSYSEPKNSIGSNLTIDLANIDQYPLIIAAQSFDFQIGKVVDGDMVWKTYLSSGKLNSTSYQITRQGDAPLTSFEFSNKSSILNKLAKSPKRDLVIYDPLKISVNLADFQTIYDIYGTGYSTQLLPVSGLTIYKLFEKIFVDRCGFAGYVTNLPNFRIKRADFTMTDTYMSGVAGVIGMFDPLIYEFEGQVWIIDTTSVLPSGFPVSNEITIHNSSSISISGNQDRIDAFLLTYNEDDLNFDYITTRLEQEVQESGQFGNDNYTKTEVTRIIREYRRSDQPNVVIMSNIQSESRTTLDRLLTIIGRTIEQYFYDSFGRQTSSQKTTEAVVPDLPSGDKVLLEVLRETSRIDYGQDPFQPSRQVQKYVIRETRGLIAIDAENKYFEADFKQDFMTAHIAGNLTTNMTSEFGLIKQVTETLRPLGNGQCQIDIRTHDFINGTMSMDKSEPRAGDYSLNGMTSRTRKILVPYEGVDLSQENLVIRNLNVGELPSQYAIPLAKRKLRKANQGPRDVTANTIGIDDTMHRGLCSLVKNANGDTMLNCLIEGFTVNGEINGVITMVEGTKIG